MTASEPLPLPAMKGERGHQMPIVTSVCGYCDRTLVAVWHSDRWRFECAVCAPALVSVRTVEEFRAFQIAARKPKRRAMAASSNPSPKGGH